MTLCAQGGSDVNLRSFAIYVVFAVTVCAPVTVCGDAVRMRSAAKRPFFVVSPGKAETIGALFFSMKSRYVSETANKLQGGKRAD